MRILLDIGHPAHVHYFRNFIRIMESREHEFMIVARDKDLSHTLLEAYNLPYLSRGRGKKNLLGKLIYMLQADFFILRKSIRFKPDIFLSFTSPYAAQVSKFFGKPHISFDDTEHAVFGHLFYRPFTNIVLTPSSYNKSFGAKQIRFNGLMELCYLHPNYYKPEDSVLDLLGVNKGEKYTVLRFVSWDANHDIGHSGLTLKMKRQVVREFSKYGKVFITSEKELPDDLKDYQIIIPPEKMHDALSFATLFIGEGATMASECAVLGTPAIYVNSLKLGYITEQEKKYGLVFSFRNSDGVIEKGVELLNNPNLKEEWQKRRQRMLADKIDVTAFMVWLIENYPESAQTVRENLDSYRNFNGWKEKNKQFSPIPLTPS